MFVPFSVIVRMMFSGVFADHRYANDMATDD